MLDIDGEEGKETLMQLESEHGPLSKTPCALTGKGLQFYFKMPDGQDKPIGNKVGIGKNVDIRGEGEFVIASSSMIWVTKA